jgi:hypothetical protein
MQPSNEQQDTRVMNMMRNRAGDAKIKQNKQQVIHSQRHRPAESNNTCLRRRYEKVERTNGGVCVCV